MIHWEYDATKYNPDAFKLIPPGKYRVRIENAEEQTTKTGKQMIKLTLKVSGYNSTIWHWLVFDDSSEEAKDRTNDRMGRVFDSFNIPAGNFNLEVWKGKAGAAEIKHEEDDKKEIRAKVKYFIPRKNQDGLPAWKDATTQISSNINPEMVDFDDGLCPY